MIKRCITCKSEKHITEFYKSNLTYGDGYQSYCKQCISIKNKEKRISKKEKLPNNTKRCTKCKEVKDIEEFIKHTSKYRYPRCKKCRNEDSREYLFKVKYGITITGFEEMLKAQKYKCKICGSKKSINSRSDLLCVDHCHTTGKIRGILCNSCNVGLGKFKDNKELLNNAIQYLSE